MKRRPNLTLSTRFGIFALFCFSCSSPYHSIDPSKLIVLHPGLVYRIMFSSAVDEFHLGTLFEDSSELSLSPLAPMFRRPLIIKADDLRARITPSWRRFIGWAEDRSYSVGLGLICNSLATAPALDIEYLRTLNRWRFELWLHGWDHEISEQRAEFQGRPLGWQERHIDSSMKWAKRKLGISLRTFGPPGNRSDESTMIVLRSSPQLKVWFDSGTKKSEQDVIGIDWIAESATGQLRSFEDFSEKVINLSEDEVIVLQIHPADWNDSDLELFGRMVDYTVNSLARRLMTPYGYYTWRRDMTKLKVEKVGEKEYLIDCTDAEYAHVLETANEPLFFEEIDGAKVLGE
ncbi:MAG: DUF2334 domain-containing protein [Candidatus Neomarinimicrobiota bacterium]|nr:DUF2334 domain-containing protein [Candidatus Neomarinimicrobiota bacterium]